MTGVASVAAAPTPCIAAAIVTMPTATVSKRARTIPDPPSEVTLLLVILITPRHPRKGQHASFTQLQHKQATEGLGANSLYRLQHEESRHPRREQGPAQGLSIRTQSMSPLK